MNAAIWLRDGWFRAIGKYSPADESERNRARSWTAMMKYGTAVLKLGHTESFKKKYNL